MRFTGQVKIPDLDYPGVPASVQVDGKQVELFVEGESLGRWSLVDVRAERLVSSAFSLKLAGEEVTFIADQPTEFAYGGVEAMANVWAKHKTMRLPLRMVANSRSRQGTKPSRIPDLRNAIEETLAGTSATALDPTPPPPRREASGIASLREATGRRVSDTEPSSDEAASPPEDRAARPRHMAPEPERAESPAEAGPADTEVTSEEHDPVPDAPDTPDVVFTEPVAPPRASDSVFKESVPWATAEPAEAEDAPAHEEPAKPSAEPEEPATVAEIPDPKEPEVASEPEVAPESGVAPEPEVAPESEEAEPEGAPVREVPQSGSVPWLAPPLPEDPVDEAKAMSAEADTPTSLEDADEVEPVRDPEYVVDLGAFEDREKVAHEEVAREEVAREEVAREEVGSEDEPAETVRSMADADADDEDEEALPMATSGARGGIMGAVRSAFVRNRVEHTHVYVEAPGGLGIKRQICAECGHISIGVQ